MQWMHSWLQLAGHDVQQQAADGASMHRHVSRQADGAAARSLPAMRRALKLTTLSKPSNARLLQSRRNRESPRALTAQARVKTATGRATATEPAISMQDTHSGHPVRGAGKSEATEMKEIILGRTARSVSIALPASKNVRSLMGEYQLYQALCWCSESAIQKCHLGTALEHMLLTSCIRLLRHTCECTSHGSLQVRPPGA